MGGGKLFDESDLLFNVYSMGGWRGGGVLGGGSVLACVKMVLHCNPHWSISRVPIWTPSGSAEEQTHAPPPWDGAHEFVSGARPFVSRSCPDRPGRHMGPFWVHFLGVAWACFTNGSLPAPGGPKQTQTHVHHPRVGVHGFALVFKARPLTPKVFVTLSVWPHPDNEVQPTGHLCQASPKINPGFKTPNFLL